MRRLLLVLALVWIDGVILFGTEPSEGTGKFWPSWRGPNSNGLAEGSDPPIEWSESKNIRWKVPLPGRGSSSPIIWGDRVFVTAAIPKPDPSEQGPPPEPEEGRGWLRPIHPTNHQFVVIAVNRRNGEILWQSIVHEGKPHAATHQTGTWASSSATTDGQNLYAYFGSQGLYCLDLEGNIVWEKDLGNMDKHLSFGEGSSPVLYEDSIFLIWDHEGPSFLFAINKTNGEEIWRVERDERTSWSTPLVVENDGGPQVITSATNAVRSYNPDNGEVIWEATGMTRNVIPTPIEFNGLVIVMSGFRGNAGMAIRLAKARGNIDDTEAIAWKIGRDTPYTPTPLLYGENLYFLKTNSSVLTCLDAATGEVVYGPQRLKGMGTVYSSPVGANGRVYITDRDGNTLVIRHGSEFEVLAKNSLDDVFDASMAIVDDQIFLRGQENLYCISR